MRVVPLSSMEQFAAVQLSDDPGAVGGKLQIPQAAQIVINWQIETGKTAHNVLYGRYVGAFAGTAAQAEAIRSAIASSLTTSGLIGSLAPSTSLVSVSIRNVNVVDQLLIFSTGAAVPGTGTLPALPAEVAACLTINTGTAGKSGRGRIYIPGFVAGAIGAGNIISIGTATALGQLGTAIRSAINANGYTHCLGLRARQSYTSPKTGTNFPPRPATTVDSVSITLKDNHWDTQRRRGLR